MSKEQLYYKSGQQHVPFTPEFATDNCFYFDDASLCIRLDSNDLEKQNNGNIKLKDTVERTTNKTSTWSESPSSSTKYPTEGLVYTTINDVSTRISNISTIGRFLSSWSLAGGWPLTNPTTGTPYEYRKGDYYIACEEVIEGKAVTVDGKVFQPVNNIANGKRQYKRRYGPGTLLESRFFPADATPKVGDTMFSNPSETTPTGGTVTDVQDPFALIPTGTSYTGAASTSHATNYPPNNSLFFYDGAQWLITSSDKTTTFASIEGIPSDNAALDASLKACDQVFVAEYDDTYYSDIKTAYDNDKAIFAKKSVGQSGKYQMFPLASYSSSDGFVFSGCDYDGNITYFTLGGDIVGWDTSTFHLENSDNRVSSITPTSENDKYPSASATFGFVDGRLGGLSFWRGTQAQYDAIATKDSSTVYMILS